MSPEEVEQKVLDEINGKWDICNAHGIDLKKCLVRPPKIYSFKDSFNNYEPKDMWLVLCEDATNDDAYLIVYDETENLYGLAVKGDKKHDVDFKTRPQEGDQSLRVDDPTTPKKKDEEPKSD